MQRYLYVYYVLIIRVYFVAYQQRGLRNIFQRFNTTHTQQQQECSDIGYSKRGMLRGNSAKTSRVKVAVRCRPAFQDEIEFAKGEFFSIVDTTAESPQQNKLGQIALTTINGKQRDFYFDYVFGENIAQEDVYDRLARPVVHEVLKGCNGTIFAYGQTGTGKVIEIFLFPTYSEYFIATICRPIPWEY
jgi:hypothetical protein